MRLLQQLKEKEARWKRRKVNDKDRAARERLPHFL